MPRYLRPAYHAAIRREKEVARQQRRAEKLARRGERCFGEVSAENPAEGMQLPADSADDLAAEHRGPPPTEQFPSARPNAPEDLAGGARTLSRNLR